MERQKNILVIDDFAPMRNTVRAGLEQSGLYNVQMFSSANQVWPVLETGTVDLILCDVNLPGMTGVELLQKVRNHPDYNELPFVLMTGDGSRSLVSHAIEIGVSDFVVKPFTLNQLKERLSVALQRKPRVFVSAAVDSGSDEVPTSSESVDQRPCVLVVDDEPLNLELVFNLLKDDYRVKVATSGKKALSIAMSADTPDLLLLDIMMPELDGYQVCEQLMSQSKLDIPVIFLSAKTEVSDVTRGFALGAVDYIYKPLEPEILKARIRTQLAQRDARTELRRSIDLLLENTRLRQDMERICRHDLKNPISSALLHLQLLLDDPYLAANYKEQLQQITQSTQMAFGLLNQSADLMRIENGTYRLRPVPVELAPLLQQVMQELTGPIQQKHLQVTTKLFVKQPVAKGEEQLCYIIFCNLLRNAIEAAPLRSEIVVSVEELQDSVAIRFYNEGAVPLEIRDTLFEKYVSSGKTHGSGLGSYSARMMTLVQKGDISFNVLNENKTVFTVTLPRFVTTQIV